MVRFSPETNGRRIRWGLDEEGEEELPRPPRNAEECTHELQMESIHYQIADHYDHGTDSGEPERTDEPDAPHERQNGD